jgi:caffeoyl-CoA O-methyltransferase
MNGIIDARLEKYMDGLLPQRDRVLAEMERYAEVRDIPIIGPAVGRLMYLFAKLSGAKRIFEMGSAIGYSTIWLARAAGPRARVYYTDGDSANERRAREYCRRAGVVNRIKFFVGDAVALLDRVPGSFDLIFMDVDKHQYPAAFRKALPRLRRRGLLITDNTLWYGRVAQTARDRDTHAVQQFNRLIYSARELFPVIIPLRDGVAVCQKL